MKKTKFNLVYTNPHCRGLSRTEAYDSKEEALTQMRFCATHDAFNSDVAESHVKDMFSIDYEDFKKKIASELYPNLRYDSYYDYYGHCSKIRLGKDNEEGEFTPDEEAEDKVMQEADKPYRQAVEEAIKALSVHGYSLDGKSYRIDETLDIRCDYCNSDLVDIDWDNLELTNHFCNDGCELAFNNERGNNE